MKMKTNSVPAVYRILLAVCILIVPLLSCSFFGIPDYELTVIVKDGVKGTPASGNYSYKDLTIVNYAYTPVNPLHTIEVTANEIRLTATNTTVTIYTNVVLEARLFDIRSTWKVTFLNSDSTTNGTSKITFSGANILGGTFSDNLGNTGTWDGTSNKITITYSNWGKYILTGTLFNMSGSWSNGSVTGTWSAVRELQ